MYLFVLVVSCVISQWNRLCETVSGFSFINISEKDDF